MPMEYYNFTSGFVRDFLQSLAIGDRMHVIEPSALLGPIGAVRAALDSVPIG